MIYKRQLQFIKSLHDKKTRHESGFFFVEGKKLVQEVLNSNLECTEIYATNEWLTQNSPSVSPSVLVYEIHEKELNKISALTSPQGVLALVKIPNRTLQTEKLKNNISLVLDMITDPGNMGTIIRIADWFGIGTVICSHHCVDAYNPKVVQSSMGSITRIDMHYTDLLSFFKSNQAEWKIPVFAADLEGENVYTLTKPQSALIVMGNESRGIDPGYRNYIDRFIHIPRYTLHDGSQTQAESLNVAIATALICAEFRRN